MANIEKSIFFCARIDDETEEVSKLYCIFCWNFTNQIPGIAPVLKEVEQSRFACTFGEDNKQSN